MKPSPASGPVHAVHRGGPTDPAGDDELRRGIIHTQISPGLSRALVAAFLLLITAVPGSQVVLERMRDDESVLPDLFRRWPTKASIAQFEEDLEKASYLREWVQPRVQWLLTGWGGFGNKKAVVGRNGWLFYAPGVLSVAGPGFLDPGVQEVRRKASLDAGDDEVHPDPRRAILDFAAALRARGVELLVLPVPDKASVEPAGLHARRSGGRPWPATATTSACLTNFARPACGSSMPRLRS